MADTVKRAAIYLRVSTDGQTTDNQRIVLEAVAQRRGWSVAATYEDAGVSGAKGRDKRPQFDAMMKDANRRRFDVVLVWAIDRLGRSTATVATALAELDHVGVAIYADREGMDATTPHGRAMLQMAAVFAELERGMIRERVVAGLERVKAAEADPASRAKRRASGKKAHGRPTISTATDRAIRESLEGGAGIIKTAKAVRVGVGTVQRVKQEMAVQS